MIIKRLTIGNDTLWVSGDDLPDLLKEMKKLWKKKRRPSTKEVEQLKAKALLNTIMKSD